MPQVSIPGADVELAARENETILAALQRSGFAVRVGCARGGCGICRIQIDQGDIDYPVKVCEQALPVAERGEGVALACRAVPVGDVVVSVPSEGRLRCIAPLLAQLAGQRPAPRPRMERKAV